MESSKAYYQIIYARLVSCKSTEDPDKQIKDEKLSVCASSANQITSEIQIIEHYEKFIVNCSRLYLPSLTIAEFLINNYFIINDLFKWLRVKIIKFSLNNLK